MNWYFEVLKKYAVFSGRARRKEYWYFALFNFIIMTGLLILNASLMGSRPDMLIAVLAPLYAFGTLIPNLAVSVRRLHDTDKSGWWLLIGFIPIIGPVVLLVFMVKESNPEQNQYGENPVEVIA